jgi:predicted nucleic acid-binding Zn ribbon protein
MTKSIIRQPTSERRYSSFRKFSETDNPPNNHCEQCGEPVYVERGPILKRIFCGEPCRNAFYNARRQRKASESLVCVQCGETFAAKRSDARYCSAKCRQQARRAGLLG